MLNSLESSLIFPYNCAFTLCIVFKVRCALHAVSRNLNRRGSPPGRPLVSVDLTADEASSSGGHHRFVPQASLSRITKQMRNVKHFLALFSKKMRNFNASGRCNSSSSKMFVFWPDIHRPFGPCSSSFLVSRIRTISGISRIQDLRNDPASQANISTV